MHEESIPERRGFDPDFAGRLAECDGGNFIQGTHFAGRQDFGGTLTGEFLEVGDPAWRWYLMIDLTLKPREYDSDAVWCLSGNVFLVDGDST